MFIYFFHLQAQMIVMKFGGSSVGDPDAIKLCAELVEREHERSGEYPVVVVSAYSKITDMLLDAADKAVLGDFEGPCATVAKRHNDMMSALGLPAEIGQKNLTELHDLLNGIHMVKEVTPRLYDYVVSFGERLSSKCFAALLRTCQPSVAAVVRGRSGRT